MEELSYTHVKLSSFSDIAGHHHHLRLPINYYLYICAPSTHSSHELQLFRRFLHRRRRRRPPPIIAAKHFYYSVRTFNVPLLPPTLSSIPRSSQPERRTLICAPFENIAISSATTTIVPLLVLRVSFIERIPPSPNQPCEQSRNVPKFLLVVLSSFLLLTSPSKHFQ